MRRALARHDELLREAVAQSGGSVFKTMGALLEDLRPGEIRPFRSGLPGYPEWPNPATARPVSVEAYE
uniref:Uncharacterized protein n=1 Tax=uncultured Armatimonadetes bacterium TaxID=157466 RepID=A0A6J4JZG9_9BACT|nr:hypothetical protein AVDCRST_MAG63-4388 [uncultured Armatimonadetes bacterium]